MKVTPVMRPGKTPGKLDAELKVADTLPFHASAELDNYNSANTDPLRLSVMMRYDNLWQMGHSASVSYQTSPQDTSQVKVLSGTYALPLNEGDQLALYAVASRSNVAAIGDMTVLGQGNIFGARWVKPLPSRGQYFHTLTLGVDYKDFTNDLVQGGTSAGTTPVAYIPFTVAYSANMQNEGGLSDGSIALNFKFRGLGDKTVVCNGQVVSQFECSRLYATPDYFYFKGGVDTTQTLFGKLSLYVKADGQVAGGPLISNEEFTAGGEQSVRGYYEAEVAGDDGVHGTVELRGPQWNYGRIDNMMLLAFWDAAHLRVRQPLAAQQATFNLESAGFGLRLYALKDFSMMLDIAWPLKSDAPYTQAGTVHVGFKSQLAF